MPTYSYACTVCDHRFDAQQSFSDPALTTCPECDGTLRKVFGNVGVVFKGSGFYRTDSRAGSGRTGKASASSKAASSSSSSSSSSSGSTGSSSSSSGSGSGSSSASTSTAGSTGKASAASA